VVEEGECDGLAAEACECFGAVGGGQDAVALVFEETGEQFALHGVVVGDQDIHFTS
jgi:hypothetical protein